MHSVIARIASFGRTCKWKNAQKLENKKLLRNYIPRKGDVPVTRAVSGTHSRGFR
jgi:hypothetical protein